MSRTTPPSSQRGAGAVGVAAVALVLAGSACGTAHTARPVGQGNGAIAVQLGGPFVEMGEGAVPLPLAVVTGKYGVTDRFDVFGSWHVLETFVADGNAMFDLGFSYYLLEQARARPGISVAVTETFLLNSTSVWTAFDVQLTASWLLHPRHLVYVGFHNFLTPLPPSVIEATPYTFAPYVGGEVRLGRKRQAGLSIQLTWSRPWAATDGKPVTLWSAGYQGAFSVTGGLSLYLEKRRAPAAGEGTP
ncbi:hypothetical protein L6R50_01175 [Myxococcota bacterium]|nr:hypothetical protein [Myxococcota bacterium]